MAVRPDPVYDRRTVADRIARRAKSEQFENLPAEAQEEYRGRWQAEVQRQIDREDVRLETRIASVISCVLLFVAVTAIWDVSTIVTIPASVVVGALTGMVWNWIDAGRFGALFTVIPGYVFLRAIAPGQSPFTIFFGFVAMATFATLLGAMREIREGDMNPTGFARRLRRVLRRDADASSVLAARGALGAVSTGAEPGVRAWGPAPEQGGDERRLAPWTEWDLEAGDPEP